MDEKRNYLEQVNALQDLGADDVAGVGEHSRMVRYSAGHLFYMPDDPGEILFVLKVGRVQLYRISSDGRNLVMADLQPGAIFGQMALIGHQMHNMFAQALDDCVICIWDKTYVENLLVQKPQVALRFLEAMGQRLVFVEEELVNVTFKSLPERMAGLLIRMNRQVGNAGVIRGYTHQYFADNLGTYRETATQILNDFRSQKLLLIGRKMIEILDEVGLEKVASGHSG